MDERSRTLWERVCATVNRLGSPRSPRSYARESAPEPLCLDLHGMTVQDAYDRTRAFLSVSSGSVMVITGKSGIIRAEFPYWLDGFDAVASYRECNGGGAFKIALRKRK